MEARRPFTCYFCNKTIEDESEMGHTSVCGSVLMPCPNKCGSYIARMDMHKHKRECVNRVGKSMPRLNSTSNYEENFGGGGVPNTASLDRKLDAPNRNVAELIARIQNDLKKLSIRLSNFEQRSIGINENAVDVKQQLEAYKSVQMQQRQDLEKIKYQHQMVFDWKRALDLQMENLRQSLSSCEKFAAERDMHWMTLQQKMMALDKLQMDVNLYRDSFLKEQNYNRQADLEFAQKLDEFKDLFDQENATIGALWNDQKLVVDEIQRQIELIHKHIDEHKAKHTSAVFDIKTVSQIASEASERIEIQEREFREMKKQVQQFRLDLEILEDLASGGFNVGVPTNSPGHIIWRISDFDAKMTKAKESGSVVKSPIFYTHDFGYRIRILVHLNGLKKWKDRYALISIHVLKGEFDPLLKWPCRIEGTVTLRDLEDLENPRHFSKYIAAKREFGDEDNEEPQESSASYIFIPHATLTKPKYLKDDAVYLDVRINQSKKLSTETTL